MYDSVDVQRYQLAYKTVIKANFNDPRELEVLARSVYFSNLRETESGVVMAGLAPAQNFSSSVVAVTGGGASGNSGSGGSGGSAGGGSSAASVLVDGYEPNDDLKRLRQLIHTAMTEYNKDQQRIAIPLYESTIALVCRLCHTVQCVGGNCCIIADGGISQFVLQLVVSILQYTLVNFKTSQFMYSKQMIFQQLRHRLVSSYYRAGIKVRYLESFSLSLVNLVVSI
jgi:hypothetical protein